MGCGPSQPAEEQSFVPPPRKGWEEGFKVKQGQKRAKGLCHAWGKLKWAGAGPAGAHRGCAGGWVGWDQLYSASVELLSSSGFLLL